MAPASRAVASPNACNQQWEGIEPHLSLPARGRLTSGRSKPARRRQRGCQMFRIWVADLDSPSYFVAVAAVELVPKLRNA